MDNTSIHSVARLALVMRPRTAAAAARAFARSNPLSLAERPAP